MPWAESSHPSFAVRFQGWIDDPTVTAIDVTAPGRFIARIPLERTPARVAEVAPDAPHAEVSVFQTPIGTATLPTEFELYLNGVLTEGQSTPLWTVRGRRAPLLDPASAPRVRPIVLHSLGRSGSSWLTSLLGHHPEILAYRPFDYEPRLMAYWLEVLRNLSDPRSYLNALRPSLGGPQWWIAEERPPRPPPERRFNRALGRLAVEELATFCRRRVEEAYLTLATELGKPDALHFVEKAPWESEGIWGLLYELFPTTREILLVRDARDVVCSMLAYDEQRGFVGFGRETRDSIDFLQELQEASAASLDRHQSLGGRSTLVRYEDLVQSPRETLARLFAHLSVGASPEVVDKVLERAAERAPQRGHRTTEDARSSIGRWRREMPAELLALTEETFSGVLEAQGYEVREHSEVES